MAVTKEQVEEIQEVVAKLRKEIDEVAKVKGNVNKTTEKMENLQDAIDKMEEKMGTVNSLDEKIKEQENIIANLEEFKKKATDFAGFETKEKEEKAKKEMEAERTAFFEYARKGDKNVGADYRKDLSSLSDSEGGYTVPEDYRQQLISKLPDESVMRGLVTVANTSRDEVKVPSLDGTFAWTWGDGTSLPAPNSEDPYGMISIPVKYGNALIKMTQVLLEDSAFNIEGHIVDEFTRSAGLEEDDVIIGGNGNDEPEGILTNADIQSNYTIISAASGAVDADDMIDLAYDLKQQYARNGKLLVRRKFVRELRKLKDNNGQYLWEPSLKEGEPATFDGYPIYQPTSSELNDEIAGGNIMAIFGDFRYYWIVDRIDMTMQRLDEKYAPLIGLYFRIRRGGKVVVPEAFRVLKVKA